jgi:predicted transcriptional regulator
MKKPSLGTQELELLRFVSECPEPLTVREITELFGEPRKLARTTILTMLERLRKKGFITREEFQGINHYFSKISKSELLQDMVKNFVEKTLGGSLTPFVAYLNQANELSDAELAEFKRMIHELDMGRTSPKG